MKFEIAMERLEEIATRMESNMLALDESIKLYEEAVKLVDICQKQLVGIEGKITQMIENKQENLEIK